MNQGERTESLRHDVERFLNALERNLKYLAHLSVRVSEQATKYDLTDYDLFREEVRSFRSLSYLIGTRFSGLEGDGKSVRFRSKFEDLQTLMLSTFVRTCIKAFFVYSAKDLLPLGHREKLLRDMVFLSEAEDYLSKRAEHTKLDVSVLDDIKVAKEVLEEITSNAPEMLDFGKKLIQKDN